MWPIRRTTIINNNIGFVPPRIHHHCFGGFGNMFNWMAGFSLAQNMLNGLFSPFRMQTYIPPYYNFSQNPGYSPLKNPIGDSTAEARRTLDSLGFTKEAGYGIGTGEDGKLIYSYTNGDNTIIANSLKELLDKQANTRQTNANEPEKAENTSVSEAGGEAVEEEIFDLTEAPAEETVQSDEGNETTDEVVNTAAVMTQYSYVTSTSKSPDGWYRSQSAGSDAYKFSEEDLKAHSGANTSVDIIVNKFASNNGKLDTNKLRSELIKKNPSVFTADGNLKDGADVSRLDIPTYKWLKSNCMKTQSVHASQSKQPKVLAKDLEYKDGTRKMQYKSGNYIYKKNGTGTLDDDAIFVIDGVKYSLKINGQNTKVDYCQITGNRKGHFMDYELIDRNTGRFNGNNSRAWGGAGFKASYRLEAEPGFTGKLDNAVIKREKDGRVTVTTNNKTYLMDDVMSGAAKV